MIIYKYVASDGDDIIKKARLRVNSPCNFNDPFELIPVIEDVTPEQVKEAVFKNDKYLRHLHKIATVEGRINKPYEDYKQEMQDSERSKVISKTMAENAAKNLRATAGKSRAEGDKIALMTCFCGETISSHHEILMWAHYAESYKGLRIAFDSNFLNIPSTVLMKMEYGKDRLRHSPTDYWENGTQSFNDLYTRMLTLKSDVWAYENEHRWLVPTLACQKDGEHYYFLIDPKAIVSVDCGTQCSPERVAFIKNLVRQNLGEAIPVRKAEIDDYEYKLKYSNCEI